MFMSTSRISQDQLCQKIKERDAAILERVRKLQERLHRSQQFSNNHEQTNPPIADGSIVMPMRQSK